MDAATGGGTVERVWQLHREFSSLRGVESRVMAVDIRSPMQHRDDHIILLPCLNRRWYFPAPKFRRLWSEVRWADVVLFTNHWTVINALLYFMVRFAGKPYMVCPAGALTALGRSRWLKGLYDAVIGRRMIRRADAVVVIAEDEREALLGYGVGPERIHHIPNGVRQGDFIFDDPTAFRDYAGIGDRPYLLFVGRLAPIKGPDILLEAFLEVAQRHQDLCLVFAGPDGGMLVELRQNASSHGVEDRVFFPGYVSGKLKSSAYHGAYVLVVPSRQEAMSIVALEAALCGTPVILTDQCGFQAMEQQGGGLIVGVDSHGIATAVRKLLENEHLRMNMGRNARELVLREYTWAKAARAYLTIANGILQGDDI